MGDFSPIHRPVLTGGVIGLADLAEVLSLPKIKGENGVMPIL